MIASSCLEDVWIDVNPGLRLVLTPSSPLAPEASVSSRMYTGDRSLTDLIVARSEERDDVVRFRRRVSQRRNWTMGQSTRSLGSGKLIQASRAKWNICQPPSGRRLAHQAMLPVGTCHLRSQCLFSPLRFPVLTGLTWWSSIPYTFCVGSHLGRRPVCLPSDRTNSPVRGGWPVGKMVIIPQSLLGGPAIHGRAVSQHRS